MKRGRRKYEKRESRADREEYAERMYIEDEFIECEKFLSTPTEDGPSCPRCGSSCYWEECETCCGDGMDGHDCGEDTCCCIDKSDNMDCDTCDGNGGWWQCGNTPEWCAANPPPGKEDVTWRTWTNER